MEKSYYAIIPANVRYDKDLPPNAKLLYGEITALCNEKGFCWAGNTYFSELYSKDKSTIARWLKQLEAKGYITREVIYKEGSREIESRYMRICSGGIGKNETTPIGKNERDNNTSFNTTINNKDIYIQLAEFVKMKESEYNKLLQEHGEPLTKKMIEVLDNYKGANGKKYKSDYRAVLNWVADKVKGEKNERFKQGGRKPNTSEYDSLSL
jgi:DNA-binding transcriptional ArsR family regulator